MQIIRKYLLFLGLIVSTGFTSVSVAGPIKNDSLEEHLLQSIPCKRFLKTSLSEDVTKKEKIGKRKYDETLSFVNKEDAEDIRFHLQSINDLAKQEFCVGFLKELGSIIKKYDLTDFDALVELFNILQSDIFFIADDEYGSMKELQKKFLNGTLTKSEFSLEHDKEHLKAVKGFVEKIKKRMEPLEQNIKTELRNTHKKLIIEQRKRAKEDVISQVLNYASGFEENASGIMFWYPSKLVKDSCYYRLAIDKDHRKAVLFLSNLEAERQLNSLGVQRSAVKEIILIFGNGLNLNSGDFQSIKFSKSYGPKDLDFFDRKNYTKFHSQIEGLPNVFECESDQCGVERLRRGWTLVSEKCKGEVKPF